MNDRESRHDDPKIYWKIHQNAIPFALQRYDGRMKKCCGCWAAFKDVTTAARPKFVIAHQKLYVYGRLKESKRIFTTQRDMFYHCDPYCIEPRRPYFDMCDMVTNPAVTRHLNESDIEHLHLLGIPS